VGFAGSRTCGRGVAVTAIFVTGTGTEVGKTFVAAALVRHLRSAGENVDAIKPVVSGFDPAAPAASDPGILLAALGKPATLEEIDRVAPWRFAAAMSPDLAAARERRSIGFETLVDFCRKRDMESPGTLIIEGVGGVMVPLDETHTVLDWMTALRFPVLLVAGSYLGTFSHTLTALHVLARRNLDIRAVIVSESANGGASLEETVATISRFADAIDVIGVPRLRDDPSAHPAFARIAQLL
jgi:dethiobiotin synthetase